MKRFSIVCGLIIASTLAPVRASAATFSQLVVYGDSLSDLGRAAAATGGAAPTYSATFGGGRFSNGPIWVEYLAASLGIPADGNPTTNPATNFAVGGATTGAANTIQPLIPFPIPALNGIQQQVTDNVVTDSAALYVLWGGANDYLGGGITDPTIPVGNLVAQINTLIGHDAKNILVPNLPNLGALPSTRNLGAGAIGLNSLTAAHNAGLATAISNLSLANPTVKLNLLDVNSLFNKVVANPSSVGFTNVTDGCFLVGCQVLTPDLSNNFLFWDEIHPTTAAHQLVGELAFNTVSPTAVPEPMTVVGSLMAFGSAIAFKRKLKSADVTAKELVESN